MDKDRRTGSQSVNFNKRITCVRAVHIFLRTLTKSIRVKYFIQHFHCMVELSSTLEKFFFGSRYFLSFVFPKHVGFLADRHNDGSLNCCAIIFNTTQTQEQQKTSKQDKTPRLQPRSYQKKYTRYSALLTIFDIGKLKLN